LSTKLCNLKSLSFGSGDAAPWLDLMGQRIETLKFYPGTANHRNLIAAWKCTNLRDLTLEHVTNEDLQGSNLWKRVGHTLEKLTLALRYSFPEEEIEDEIQKIQFNCRKIKHIDIRWQNHRVPGLSACLCSYKSQLQYIFIAGMCYEELKEVVEQCTNAWFNIALRGCKYGAFLSLIGKQLSNIRFLGIPISNEDRTEMVTGWDLCPNLKEIRDDGPRKHHEIQAIFNTPKVFLTEVTFDFLHIEDIRNSVEALAKATSLESIHLKLQFPPSNEFKKLVKANKNLSKARIDFDLPDDDDRDDLIEELYELITHFLDSPNMKHLEIGKTWNSANTEDGVSLSGIDELIYRDYRHRRLYVRIFDSVVF